MERQGVGPGAMPALTGGGVCPAPVAGFERRQVCRMSTIEWHQSSFWGVCDARPARSASTSTPAAGSPGAGLTTPGRVPRRPARPGIPEPRHPGLRPDGPLVGPSRAAARAGGGDILRRIAAWTAKPGIAVALTELAAVCPHGAMRLTPGPPGQWISGDLFSQAEDARFDVVVCSLLAHHRGTRVRETWRHAVKRPMGPLPAAWGLVRRDGGALRASCRAVSLPSGRTSQVSTEPRRHRRAVSVKARCCSSQPPRAASITARKRRTTAGRPSKTLCEIRKWPIETSVTSGIAAIGPTVS